MMMHKRRGLGHKLWKVFLLQATLIGLTTILGVFAARYILGDVLIKAALENEAEYFWSEHDQTPDFPRPHTYNLTAYLADIDVIPGAIQELSPGFHEIKKEDSDLYLIYVTDHDGERLWLEFDGKQVSELAMFFGLLPLAIVLIVIYLSSWLSYSFSRRAVSPIIQLARQVEKIDPTKLTRTQNKTDFFHEDMEHEVAVLAKALEDFAESIERFVERERNFTRDASHELRSPITVIKIATDMLLEQQDLNDKQRDTIERVKRSAADMEELIEALLLLARDSDEKLSIEPVCVNDVIEEEIERAQIVYRDKPVTVDIKAQCRLTVEASDKVLSMLIGNILRNAFSYTDEGQIRIDIKPDAVTIADSGVGMNAEEVQEVFKPFFRTGQKPRGGHGVGLTIVKMLADRFRWVLTIDSTPNVGTTVRIEFPAFSVIHY